MLVRVAWKLILVLCVALAVALGVLWLRTRKSDLVASGATRATYREVRAGGGTIALTFVTGWPVDERMRVGRPVTRPDVYDVQVTSATGSPPQARTFTLLDGNRITHQTTTPAKLLAWPPARATGTAYMVGLPKKHLVASTMPSQGNVVIGSFASISTNRVPTTLPGAGTMTVTFAATMPALATNSNPATATANAITASLRGDTDITFHIAAAATTVPAFTGVRLTGAGRVFRLPSYPFERYAVPILPLAGVVLLPVYLALILASARAIRRRARRSKGLCESCGYDLRASPAGGACPECGSASSTGPSAPSGDALLARLR